MHGIPVFISEIVESYDIVIAPGVTNVNSRPFLGPRACAGVSMIGHTYHVNPKIVSAKAILEWWVKNGRRRLDLSSTAGAMQNHQRVSHYTSIRNRADQALNEKICPTLG